MSARGPGRTGAGESAVFAASANGVSAAANTPGGARPGPGPPRPWGRLSRWRWLGLAARCFPAPSGAGSGGKKIARAGVTAGGSWRRWDGGGIHAAAGSDVRFRLATSVTLPRESSRCGAGAGTAGPPARLGPGSLFLPQSPTGRHASGTSPRLRCPGCRQGLIPCSSGLASLPVSPAPSHGDGLSGCHWLGVPTSECRVPPWPFPVWDQHSSSSSAPARAVAPCLAHPPPCLPPALGIARACCPSCCCPFAMAAPWGPWP